MIGTPKAPMMEAEVLGRLFTRSGPLLSAARRFQTDPLCNTERHLHLVGRVACPVLSA